MDTLPNSDISLDAVTANRSLVDQLAAHGVISGEAREYALAILYPARNWGLWISRLLAALGVSLVLSGIVYFFAFNWDKITPAVKLGSLQLVMLACLVGSYFCGLHRRLSGKMLLLSASVIAGVFLAVFGQIYQTGADAYQLFATWAVLILPWVLIAEFAALWILWLAVANTFLILWWGQAAGQGGDAYFLILSYLVLFNGVFLGLREYLSIKSAECIGAKWTRNLLVLAVLVYAMIPTIHFLLQPAHATYSIVIGALLSLIVHIAFYVIYRFKFPDLPVLAAVVLSVCVAVEVALFKWLGEAFSHRDAALWLLGGLLTLAVFTFAVVWLRLIAKRLEVSNG